MTGFVATLLALCIGSSGETRRERWRAAMRGRAAPEVQFRNWWVMWLRGHCHAGV